jgi:signal peptidase I
VRKFLKATLWIAGVLAVVLGVLFAFFFDVWTIPTDDAQLAVSIEPTLHAGDVVVVSRRTNPDRGVMARCEDPDAPGRYVVARVVASGNEDVEIAGGVLRINGRNVLAPGACDPPKVTLVNPATGEPQEFTCSREELGGGTHMTIRFGGAQAPTAATVPGGRLYLVSDNRYLHLDSRDFGAVPSNTCNRIVFRLWGADGPGDSSRRFDYVF